MRTKTLLVGIILGACSNAEDRELKQLISEQTTRLENERTVLSAEKISDIKQKCGGKSYMWQTPGQLFLYNANEGSFVHENTYPAGADRSLPGPIKSRLVDNDGNGLVNERILLHVNPQLGKEETIETIVYFDAVKYEEYVRKMVRDAKEDIGEGERLDLRKTRNAIATGFAGAMLDQQKVYAEGLEAMSILPDLDTPMAQLHRSPFSKITCPAEIPDKYRTKAGKVHEEEKPIKQVPLPVYPTELKKNAPEPQLVVDVSQLCNGRSFDMPLTNLGLPREYLKDEAVLYYNGQTGGFVLEREHALLLHEGTTQRTFQTTMTDAKDPLGILDTVTDVDILERVGFGTEKPIKFGGNTETFDVTAELKKPDDDLSYKRMGAMTFQGLYKTALETTNREYKGNIVCK